MINAWIVVRQEQHIEDKYWLCLERDDALGIASDVTEYWREKYKLDADEVDETLYADLIFNYNAEDAFRVFAQPQQIRERGEHQAP